MKHPNFILGILSIFIVIFGVALKSYGYRASDYIIIGAIIMGGIHWIWGIIDVNGTHDMKPEQKKFWRIAVIAAPAIGALLYYAMHQTKNKLTT